MLNEMDLYTKISFILVIVGGILLGLHGLFNFSLLGSLLGGLSRLIEIIIGVGAGWLAYKIYLEKFKKM